MPGHEPFRFHTLDDLRAAIERAGLDLEATDDLSPLLEPAQVAGFTLPNRLVVLPMEGADGRDDGAPDELTFRRYRRFAAGGAGLLWMEATAVVAEGRANPRQLWLHDAVVPAFRALVEQTLETARRECGHRPLLVVQLTHSGRYSRPGRYPAPIIAHRSPRLDPLHNLTADYPVISDQELERLEDCYVEAALCAQKAGFDAVDVKACHGYLVSELLASHTREGRYGGPLEDRSRFLRRVVTKIRRASPGLIVTSRMNAYDAMPYPYGFGMDRSGSAEPDLRDPIEVVRFLHENGTPLVNITIGNPYFNPHVNRPFDLPVAGAPVPPESPLEGVARFTQIVRRIQTEFPGMAVIGGGYSWLRQFFANVAAANVKKGWVSLVGVGRLAFAYPDFARDLQQHGRVDPERVCVACSACTQIMRDGGRTGCVPRDAAIYEPIYKVGRAEALETIIEMAKTCRQCNDPACVTHCPARVEVPEFVGHIAAGRFREAYETLRRANVLAAICGYVCPAETLCEGSCINAHYTETVPIRHLQRWVSRKAVEEGWAAEPRATAPPSGKRVAVLGAGPAGIAASATLASLGHEVALFEARPVPGGVAGGTISRDRLPDPLLAAEIEAVLGSSGAVRRRTGVPLGRAYTLEHVLSEGFDGAVVALGLRRSVPLPGATRPRSGVVGALEFLEGIKRGEPVSGNVLVLGGGNTAIDAALSAQRAGANSVGIVYRRSFAEMPAWPDERDAAIRAGVHFLILTQPLDYVVDTGGRLTGVKVARTSLAAAGDNGRRVPRPIPGTEHVLPADVAVEAIGQQAGDELREALPGVAFGRAGLVQTQGESLETNRAGVFAAGDIVNGGTTVVQAVAEGTRAARELDRWMRKN